MSGGSSRGGFVLTGGKSSRMGTNKAFLAIAGSTLIEQVAKNVALAAGRVTLIGPDALYGHLGFPVVPDILPDSGPLAGIATALFHTGCEWNLIAACDMPALTVSTLRSLLSEAEQLPPHADCLIPYGHPLCAVYRRRCAEPLQASLRAGIRRVHTALESLRVFPAHSAHETDFQNVNTPEDWSSYQASQS